MGSVVLNLILKVSLVKNGSILEGELQNQLPLYSFLNGSLKVFIMDTVLDLSYPV